MNWDELVNSMDDSEFAELCSAVDNKRALLIDFTQEEIDLWREGQRIQAIKSFRARTNAGLKQAKDLFERRL